MVGAADGELVGFVGAPVGEPVVGDADGRSVHGSCLHSTSRYSDGQLSPPLLLSVVIALSCMISPTPHATSQAEMLYQSPTIHSCFAHGSDSESGQAHEPPRASA